MGQYQAKPGTPKSDLTPDGATSNAFAVLDPKTQQPVANGAHNVWVTETALTTALNSYYMAAQLGLFAIVVGVALLLCGIGGRSIWGAERKRALRAAARVAAKLSTSSAASSRSRQRGRPSPKNSWTIRMRVSRRVVPQGARCGCRVRPGDSVDQA